MSSSKLNISSIYKLFSFEKQDVQIIYIVVQTKIILQQTKRKKKIMLIIKDIILKAHNILNSFKSKGENKYLKFSNEKIKTSYK